MVADGEEIEVVLFLILSGTLTHWHTFSAVALGRMERPEESADNICEKHLKHIEIIINLKINNKHKN